MNAKLWLLAAVALGIGTVGRAGVDGTVAMPALDHRAPTDRIDVMTYNVGALPWPLAFGRPEALAKIADRLAALRAEGRAPDVVVLQEAFTDEARAIGARAGYRYEALGPGVGAQRPAAAPLALPGGRQFLRGETIGPVLSSGLVILSDYRITAVRSTAFPADACAGYDCLANKGALAATLAVPGVADPVEIVTTHLNSGNPSGRPETENRLAFSAQMKALGRFVDAGRGRLRRTIQIVAGDFNMGHSPGRLALLAGYIRHWKMKPAAAMGRDKYAALCRSDEASCRGDLAIASNVPLIHSNDWQFYPSDESRLRPSSREVLFTRDPKGAKMLSDHIGFSVVYRFQ